MRLLILTIAALLGLIAGGCISDGISTSPGDVLTFSRDTVNFDTVFTGVGTPTARLWVYNHAKKGIEISSIRFRNPEQTTFSINVDGVSGKSFSNVEIRGGDSILVFLECYLPETQTTAPALTEEDLLFLTNGVEQTVKLEAWGQNVTRLRRLTVDRDMTLTAERPYVIFDTLTVEKGAKLTIEPGAQVLFHDKAFMQVRGTLEAVGAPGKMIAMRGDRLDNVLPNAGYDILAGQWGGIRIESESFDNRLEYVDMRSTTSGLCIDSTSNLDHRKLLMINSWLHNSQGTAFRSDYAWVDAYGCVFSEAAEAVVRLTGGRHTFSQCTLANNYLFSAITEPLLTLRHVLPKDAEENGEPLMQLSMENSIIYGLAGDINTGDLTDSNAYLRNVLMKSKGTNDDHFIDCVWGEDPLFWTVRSDYYFNYRVKEASPAIGAGNPDYVTELCRTDMTGRERLIQGNPTLGAYAYDPDYTPEGIKPEPQKILRRN